MRGTVTAVVEGGEFDLLTVKVPRGTGFGLDAELEMAQVGHVGQSFPVLKDGKRVVNTTASLEAGTQQFKG